MRLGWGALLSWAFSWATLGCGGDATVFEGGEGGAGGGTVACGAVMEAQRAAADALLAGAAGMVADVTARCSAMASDLGSASPGGGSDREQMLDACSDAAAGTDAVMQQSMSSVQRDPLAGCAPDEAAAASCLASCDTGQADCGATCEAMVLFGTTCDLPAVTATSPDATFVSTVEANVPALWQASELAQAYAKGAERLVVALAMLAPQALPEACLTPFQALTTDTTSGLDTVVDVVEATVAVRTSLSL